MNLECQKKREQAHSKESQGAQNKRPTTGWTAPVSLTRGFPEQLISGLTDRVKSTVTHHATEKHFS